MALSANSVVNVLQEEFRLNLAPQRPAVAIRFDAVLRSPDDPMPLVVVDDISRSTGKAIRDTCRKLESFIWNLYRAGKVNSVTAIFLIGTVEPTELILLSRRLSGIGRLFFVKLSLTRDELVQVLRPLVPPKLSRIKTDDARLASIAAKSEEVMSELANASVISQWMQGRITADNLKSKVSGEFDRLLKDLQNAIK